MSQILKVEDTTEAEDFGGNGAEAVIRVSVPNNGAWITGGVVKLQWRSKFEDEEDVYYDENVEWDASGPKTVFLSRKTDYKLHASVAGFHAWIDYLD